MARKRPKTHCYDFLPNSGTVTLIFDDQKIVIGPHSELDFYVMRLYNSSTESDDLPFDYFTSEIHIDELISYFYDIITTNVHLDKDFL